MPGEGEGAGGAARAPANWPGAYGVALTGRPGIAPAVGGIPGAAGAAGPKAASALSDAGGGRAVTGNALFFLAWAARSRSAGVPCLSPLPSFLKAYWQDTALFIKN